MGVIGGGIGVLTWEIDPKMRIINKGRGRCVSNKERGGV